MTCNLCCAETKLFPASERNRRPRLAHPRSLAATLELRETYLAFLAFFIDDLLDGLPGAVEFKLSQVAVFRFFEDTGDKITAPKYPLICFFFLPSPAHGDDLGPPALASDESTASKLGASSHRHTFFHKSAVGIPGRFF